MNVQELFRAIKDLPDQSTLIVAALELERQGYSVTVDNRFHGSHDLIVAEEGDELANLPYGVGINFTLQKGLERESFKLHFLDLDAVAITDVVSPPVMYNPDFTIGEFR